jgi:hypothetical protein
MAKKTTGTSSNSSKSSLCKKWRTVRLSNDKRYLIRGETALNGDRMVGIKHDGCTVHVPYAAFAGGGDASKRLAEAGIVVIKGWNDIRDAVDQLRDFPISPLISKVGWTNGYFALPSGEVFSPPGQKKGIALFLPDPAKVAKAGEKRLWFREVARPLADQTLAAFVLMIAFAPPLLELTNRGANFGFEIVSEPGAGKSTLLQLMASAVGDGLGIEGTPYWMTCSATANGLEQALAQHRDMPLILEEAALYAADGSRATRGNAFRELVFRLADGSSKARFNEPRQVPHRAVYAMSSNTSLATLLRDEDASVADAAADRLITLKIAADRPHGTFDRIPAEHADAGAFAEALKAGARENHGHAFARYVRGLVKHRAADHKALRRRIEKDMARFRRRVGVDRNDGSAARVADAFGLVLAAGRLAQRYGALPKRFRCIGAATEAYRLYRSHSRPLPPFRERLEALLVHPRAIDLDTTKLTRMSEKKLDKVAVFVRTNRRREREFLLTEKALFRICPDWRSLKHQPEAQALWHRDKGRNTQRRRVRKGRRDWLFRFVLPEGDED